MTTAKERLPALKAAAVEVIRLWLQNHDFIHYSIGDRWEPTLYLEGLYHREAFTAKPILHCTLDELSWDDIGAALRQIEEDSCA